MGWITIGRGSWCIWEGIVVVQRCGWRRDICFTRHLWGVMWWLKHGYLPGCTPLASIADATGLASRIDGRWTLWSPPVLPVGISWFRSSTGKEGGSAWRWRRRVCKVSVVGVLFIGASAGVVLRPVLRVVRLFSAAWGASVVSANKDVARNQSLRR